MMLYDAHHNNLFFIVYFGILSTKEENYSQLNKEI
jgi:hypothetical protein